MVNGQSGERRWKQNDKFSCWGDTSPSVGAATLFTYCLNFNPIFYVQNKVAPCPFQVRARLSCLPNRVKSVRRRFPCKFEISQQWMLPSSSLDLDTLNGAPHHLACEPSTTMYMENCKSSCDLLWNFSTYQRASPRLHALRGDLLVFLPNNKQRVNNDRNERETLWFHQRESAKHPNAPRQQRHGSSSHHRRI